MHGKYEILTKCVKWENLWDETKWQTQAQMDNVETDKKFIYCENYGLD
jgi:hypothetical protein